LRAAEARSGGARTALEGELASIDTQLRAKEAELAALTPTIDAHRVREGEVRRAHDETRGRLAALFAKQGHAARFRTRSERDAYLTAELASLEAHRTAQADALTTTREELQRTEAQLEDIGGRLGALDQRAEDGRMRVRTLSEEIAKLAEERAEMTERRKELWREDAKVDAARTHALDELKSGERALGGMMDRVSFLTL
jgi:structural maintenance of chromosome 3 (chondroitin sulfate proteoglycan 6)